MSSLRNPKGAGRKRKYDNQEEQFRLKKLVYLYRDKNPSGIIKQSHMVRFSEEMNQHAPDEFPIVYNKDVWATWGKSFIELANEPISIKFESNDGINHEIPNFSDLVEKYINNKQKLLEHLLSCENFLHKSIAENYELKTQKNVLEENVKCLKQEVLILSNTINKYQSLVLEMAHHSGVEKYREKYGLKNHISPSINREAFDNMDNLRSFLEPQSKNSTESDDIILDKKDNVLLANWTQLRK